MRPVFVRFRALTRIELLIDLVLAEEPLQPTTEFFALTGSGSVAADGAGHGRPTVIGVV